MVTPQELIRKISDNIIAYMLAGKRKHVPSAVFKHFTYDGLDRYPEMEKLLNIHFIIQEAVMKYVEELPRWLRSIKRELRRHKLEGREIRGKIEWGETYETRYTRNYKDTSLFVSADPEKEYNIPENLLLKKFVSILYEIVQEDLQEFLGRHYDWVEDWEEKEEQEGLSQALQQTFERNVHLSRIKDVQKIEVTPRAIEKSLNSRKDLYRRAAKHYAEYTSYLQGEAKKIQCLFQSTAIKPDDPWRIFEVYFLFTLINQLNALTNGTLEQKLVKAGVDWAARFADGTHQELKVYYNQTPQEVTIRPEEGKRRRLVDEIYQETLTTYFGAAQRTYTTRPDAMVTFQRNGHLEDILLFEVKYSSRKETIFKGIKELTEYLVFLRNATDDSFFFADIGDMNHKAALIVEDFPSETATEVNGQGILKIFSYSDLEETTKFSELLQNASFFTQ